MHDLALIRRDAKQRRQQIGPALRNSKNKSITKHLLRQPFLQNAKRIGCYVASNGEPKVNALQALVPAIFYWPVIGTNQSVLFGCSATPSRWRENQYGIKEPQCSRYKLKQAAALDVILVPLVAFNKHCDRLGMGGGYYDRALALNNQQQRPIIIGVAYDTQLYPALTPKPWDIPMDAVVTEVGMYWRYSRNSL